MNTSPGYSPRHYCLQPTPSGNCIPCIDEKKSNHCKKLYRDYKTYGYNGDIENELVSRIKHHTECTSGCLDKGHLNYLHHLLKKIRIGIDNISLVERINNLKETVQENPTLTSLSDVETIINVFNTYEKELPLNVGTRYTYNYYKPLLTNLKEISLSITPEHSLYDEFIDTYVSMTSLRDYVKLHYPHTHAILSRSTKEDVYYNEEEEEEWVESSTDYEYSDFEEKEEEKQIVLDDDYTMEHKAISKDELFNYTQAETQKFIDKILSLHNQFNDSVIALERKMRSMMGTELKKVKKKTKDTIRVYRIELDVYTIYKNYLYIMNHYFCKIMSKYIEIEEFLKYSSTFYNIYITPIMDDMRSHILPILSKSVQLAAMTSASVYMTINDGMNTYMTEPPLFRLVTIGKIVMKTQDLPFKLFSNIFSNISEICETIDTLYETEKQY